MHLTLHLIVIFVGGLQQEAIIICQRKKKSWNWQIACEGVVPWPALDILSPEHHGDQSYWGHKLTHQEMHLTSSPMKTLNLTTLMVDFISGHTLRSMCTPVTVTDAPGW